MVSDSSDSSLYIFLSLWNPQLLETDPLCGPGSIADVSFPTLKFIQVYPSLRFLFFILTFWRVSYCLGRHHWLFRYYTLYETLARIYPSVLILLYCIWILHFLGLGVWLLYSIMYRPSYSLTWNITVLSSTGYIDYWISEIRLDIALNTTYTQRMPPSVAFRLGQAYPNN